MMMLCAEQALLLALPVQPPMSLEITGAPHMKGLRERKETGGK